MENQEQQEAQEAQDINPQIVLVQGISQVIKGVAERYKGQFNIMDVVGALECAKFEHLHNSITRKEATAQTETPASN